MPHNSNIHNRRSIRLKGYDYSSGGAYFITVCTQGRECLFGQIADGEMRMNDEGRIVAEEWLNTGQIRDNVQLDEWVVMPNHFHGIVVIADDRRGTANIRRGTARRAPTAMHHSTTVEQFGKPVSGSIPTIIRSFKSAATKRINELRQMPGAKLWQRNYYEHIIRRDDEMNKIREYILNNPAQWAEDKENPLNNSGNICHTVR